MIKPVMHFSVLPYVPNRFAWAFVFSLGSLFAIVQLNLWLLVIILVLIALCLTTRYMVEVNINEKWFKEYVWVLGIKSGEKVKYSGIDYLFINRGKVTQTTSSRVQSTTVIKDQYRGFIRFDGNEKIHILTHTNQERLTKEMRKAAQALQARLFDYSSGQSVQIV